jgi:hypothetical protein
LPSLIKRGGFFELELFVSDPRQKFIESAPFCGAKSLINRGEEKRHGLQGLGS